MFDDVKMTAERLEGLKAEMRIIDGLRYLSFDLKDECKAYLRKEINAIQANEHLYDKVKNLRHGGII